MGRDATVWVRLEKIPIAIQASDRQLTHSVRGVA